MMSTTYGKVESPDFWTIVVIAVIVFVGFFTAPFWYNFALGDTAYEPHPEIAAAAGNECIMPIEEIRVEHMELLDDWRDEAIREGKRNRVDLSRGARLKTKSLSNTCLGCHTDREAFCSQCHEYAGVETKSTIFGIELHNEVYCWDCHVDSETGKRPPPPEGGDLRREGRE